MKFNEYPIVTTPPTDAYALIDSDTEGTKRISAAALAGDLPSCYPLKPSVTHRNYFRGENLGDSVTAAQYAAIADGSFDDIYTGDYWEINGVKWRVADFNYWLNTGDSGNGYQNPHILIVPDSGLYDYQMNDTNTTEGGYVNSKMYKTGLNTAKNTVQTIFGSNHIVNHREALVNAVTNGVPSGYAWYDSTVELMTSQMVYGNTALLPTSTGTSTPSSFTIDKQQLALFQMAPEFVNIRQTYWLRDVVRNEEPSVIKDWGSFGSWSPTLMHLVRPVFGIC